MARTPSVDYTPYSTEQSTGNLGGGMGVHSSAADFGSQVGASEEKAGDAGFDLVQKQQGMINETAMTAADTQLAIQAGKLNADYKSLTGMAAYAAYPKYQSDLEQLRRSKGV